MKKEVLEKIVMFRITKKEFKRINALAGMYAGGDRSAWIRHCLKEYKPKMLKKKK